MACNGIAFLFFRQPSFPSLFNNNCIKLIASILNGITSFLDGSYYKPAKFKQVKCSNDFHKRVMEVTYPSLHLTSHAKNNIFLKAPLIHSMTYKMYYYNNYVITASASYSIID